MKRAFFYTLTLLIMCVCSKEVVAQQFVVVPDSSRFLPSELIKDKDTLLIGDQALWRMSVKAPAGSAAQFAVELSKELVPGVELLEAKIDTIKGRRSREWIFQSDLRITSFDSGSYLLPPMPLYLLRPSGAIDTLWFAGPALEVTTIPIDTTTYQPFDIKAQMTYPVTVKEVLPWGGVLLLLLLLAYALYRWIRYRKEQRPLFGKPKPKEPAYLVAFRQLEEIKAQKLWQNGKVKLFYTAVTDVLRIYVAARWGIQAMEQTSTELLESLKQEALDKPLLTALSAMLETADLVKFAKYQAGAAENEEAIPVVVHFVQATMLVQEEAPEVKEKEEDA
ncbi:MAG: hypothetical protein FWG54_05655 [Bacteroidetes bacterium]|nr:hypothetical protein [Bacteroidota bacterium]